MKNYIRDGDTMTVTAPAALTAGQGFFLGAVFLVALNDAASGATVVGYRVGVFELPAVAADAWIAGDKLYFVAASSSLTDVSANGVLIGVADNVKVATTQTKARVVVTGQVV